jgi:interferon gamma-inducible protein 30
VDVYYEVLCPDSRYFVQHELLPAHAKLGDALDVRLWPYGKATTTSDGKGSWRFQCQHGPEECEGNIWHACAAVHVASQAIRLQMVECMIDDNDDAAAAASRCAGRLGVELEGMAACAGGEEGRRLHWQAGLDTDRLQPKVSFIPTIKLEGSQGSQKAILKNFLKEVCKVYEEKYHELPEGCPPT